MKSGFIIYGCYGYTGKLIADQAIARGIKPVLAGRDGTKVKEMAQKLGLEYRIFDLGNIDNAAENIKDFKIVLHCAGPFIFTARPMAEACLKAQTHYLDITGEYQVFEDLYSLEIEARTARILIMPGVGFDVVPTDCLALYLKEALAGASSLELALYPRHSRSSQGTAITVAENLGYKTMLRKGGVLVSKPNGKLTKTIKIGDEKLTGVAISWGDISSAYRTTHIPNITVYNVLPEKIIRSMRLTNYIGFILRMRPVKNYIVSKIKKRPPGPDEDQRKKASTTVWGKVKNDMGAKKEAILELPEGYTLTAMTAVEIVRRLLDKEPSYGVRTPATEFGKDFILGFEGVTRKDVE